MGGIGFHDVVVQRGCTPAVGHGLAARVGGRKGKPNHDAAAGSSALLGRAVPQNAIVVNAHCDPEKDENSADRDLAAVVFDSILFDLHMLHVGEGDGANDAGKDSRVGG